MKKEKKKDGKSGLFSAFFFFFLNRFATRERNALLLYNGRFNEKHDFIALEIVDEQIQLTFSGGSANFLTALPNLTFILMFALGRADTIYSFRVARYL